MLKMMKMNHKLMNQKTVSSNESSEEEEDLKNNKGYFSGKLKLPMNIKDVLNEYTKTLLNRTRRRAFQVSSTKLRRDL
jgi:hypothetical protein